MFPGVLVDRYHLVSGYLFKILCNESVQYNAITLWEEVKSVSKQVMARALYFKTLRTCAQSNLTNIFSENGWHVFSQQKVLIFAENCNSFYVPK